MSASIASVAHGPAFKSPAADRTSDSIAIARVICIMGVVYVHAWTGLDSAALNALRGSGQDMLRWVLMEAFGRSAVPLLGLISGWLVMGSSKVRNFRPHVTHKARTILLPMVLWNAIAILLVSGAALVAGLRAPIPPSLEWVAQELFILTRNPDINVQMPFLRDLFLCMVAAPLLVRLPIWAIAIVAAVAAGATVTGMGPPVLMRTSILAFFAIGMIARRMKLERKAAALPLGLAILPFLFLLPAKLYMAIPGNDFMLSHAHEAAAVDLAVRIAAALAFWRLAWALAGSMAAGPLKRIEPYMFFMFCAHLIFIWLFSPMIGKVTGPLGSPAYPAFLMLQPVLALGASVVIAKLLLRVAPDTAEVLSGGRLSRRKADQKRPIVARTRRLAPAQ